MRLLDTSKYPYELAAFLEEKLGDNLRLLLHLRPSRRMSREYIESLFDSLVSQIQSETHATVG